MLSFRQVHYLLVILIAMAGSTARATEAVKLLPADTSVIVTVNLRQILFDHRNTDFAQRYLDQWRLALNGTEAQLKKYYQQQELAKCEGISEQEFLSRCGVIKTISDAFGMDPLEDVERITVGFKIAAEPGKGDGGFLVVLVEGRFKQEKFKTAVPRMARDFFGSFNANQGPGVWQVPDDPAGMCVSLLTERTMAFADSRKTMNVLLALAHDKKKDGLSRGVRSLLEAAQKEHVGVVVAGVDVLLNDLVHFLKEDVAKSIGANDMVGKFIVTQVVDWTRKYAGEVTSAGLGLSVREDDARLQFGVDARNPAAARELHTQLQRGNFWAALALKAIVNNDIAQGLADILIRQRITLRETTLLTSVEVPFDFVKLAVKGPWIVLLSKDFAPAGGPDPMAGLGQAAADAVMTRITSIPLWTLPKSSKLAGLHEVLEIPGVAYRSGQADPFRHRLDMYLPKDKKDFPVVVMVHGGAWIIGDNRLSGLFTSVGQFLASQGIGVVMPNYRLSPGVKHPEHIKDVARAVAWTHANIAKHGGDPKKLYIGGHSAGGHLVALLATDETYLRAEGLTIADIKGVIAVSGVYKVPPGAAYCSIGGSGSRALRIEQKVPLRGDSPPAFPFQPPGIPGQLNLFGPVFGDTEKECALASPLTHVRRGLPPFLIMVAEHDLPTLADMATEFQQALQREGCDARLLRMAKRNHNSLMFSAIGTDDPAARSILEFIRK